MKEWLGFNVFWNLNHNTIEAGHGRKTDPDYVGRVTILDNGTFHVFIPNEDKEGAIEDALNLGSSWAMKILDNIKNGVEVDPPRLTCMGD